MAKPERHLASHIFNVVVLVVGIVAVALMIHQQGLATVRAAFADVGWKLAAIVALDLAATCFDAAAIHAFMRPEARMVSYWRVLAAQASGRAVNIFIPGGAVGEATKVTMLVGHATRTRAVSSIVLFNLASLYLAVAIVVVGVPLTAMLVHLPHQLEVVVWIALVVVVAAVVAIGIIVHRGALDLAVSAIRGLRLISTQRAEVWRAKLSDVDRHLRELHGERSPGTRAGFALVFASRLCSSAATIAVLAVVGAPLRATLLIGVLSVGVLIGWMSALVPFGIGIADGGNYALFDVLGASGALGALVAMIARARSLAMGLIGLAVMAGAHAANRASIAKRRARSAVS